MNIDELVIKNRSYRSFDESREILKDELISFIDLARHTPSAMNKQPLKYKLITEDDDKKFMLSSINLAAILRDLKLPPIGHAPTAYIIICVDEDIRPTDNLVGYDAGIVSQTILLKANEVGLGGCIVCSFNKDEVIKHFNLSSNLKPFSVLILGKPDETCLTVDTDETKLTAYYRKDGIHYVPKRTLEDILL